jgi:dienelactone hydrolase
MSPAAGAPLWGRLRPGPYAVGYTARAEHDPTRTSVHDTGKDGAAPCGPRAVDLRLWYPAEPSAARAGALRYGGYLAPPAGDAAGSLALEGLRQRTLALLRDDLLDGAEDRLQELLSLPTAARRDASPAPGRFPWLLYAGGLNSGVEENSVLFEYLASHGHVVVAVASLGEGWVNASTNAVSVLTAAADLAFARGAARSLLPAEPASLAAAGFSLGACAALALRMRDPSIQAVAALDPSFAVARHHGLAAADPFWDPARAAVPLLVLHADHPDTDLAIVGSLRHSERRLLRMPGLRHVDFTAYAPVLDAFGPGGGTPQTARGRRGYEQVCRLVRGFLDARLGGGALPRGLRRIPAQPPPPDEGTLAREARAGVAALLRMLRRTRARHPAAPALGEEALERVAAGVWSTGMRAESVALARWAAAHHPGSLRLQRLAVEVLELTGAADDTLRHHRRALQRAADHERTVHDTNM